MASAEDYAAWIVANKDKQGTPEFETVANAYKLARSGAAQPKGGDPVVAGEGFKQAAQETGMGEALAVGAGRAYDKAAMGLKQATLGIGGVLSEILPKILKDPAQKYLTDELTALQKSEAEKDAPYTALQKERPISTAVGEGATLALTPMVRPFAGAGAASQIGNAAISNAIPSLLSYGTAKDKVTDALVAGGLGAGATAAVRGASRVISPEVSPQLKTLLEAGVTPTPGQVMGGTAKRIEDKMTSAPLLGDAIVKSQTRAVEEFNKAAINRGLSKIGEKVDEVGREGVEQAAIKISDAYENLLPKLSVKVDQPFAADLQKIHGMAQNLPEPQAKQFNTIVGQNLANRFSPNGGMAGETLKEAESTLGYYVRQYKGAGDPDQRMLGDALQEVQKSLRDLVTRSNPQHAKELKDINTAFANQVRVERAAGLNKSDGIFSPANLASAVKAEDRSARKNQFAKGNALMQDLSDAGVSVLGRSIPDSGTAGRVGVMAALANPSSMAGTAAGALGGSLLYTEPAQKVIAAILAKRPELAIQLGQQVNNAAPRLGMATGAAGAAYLSDQ